MTGLPPYYFVLSELNFCSSVIHDPIMQLMLGLVLYLKVELKNNVLVKMSFNLELKI